MFNVPDTAIAIIVLIPALSFPLQRLLDIDGRDNGICSLREKPSAYEVGSACKIGHPRGENRRFLGNTQ